MDKSPDAFRTISEVAEALETPAHVLRFWESRFPQIKPVKRAGGRRYYRPADVALLGGIRHLLHDDGMTIRGVQKILREQGVRHVAAMAPGGGDLSVFDVEDDDLMLDLTVSGEPAVETGQVLPMEPVARRVTVLPDTPAEIVQLRAASDVPEGAPDAGADLSQGFMLPTANRRPLPTLEPEPTQDDVPEAAHIWVDDPEPELNWSREPLLPFEAGVRRLEEVAGGGGDLQAEGGLVATAPPDDPVVQDLVAEAMTAEFTLVQANPAASADVPVLEESPEVAAAFAKTLPPNMSGVAARLRALPRPALATSVTALTEVQMRLGLLHAQMAEALRARK